MKNIALDCEFYQGYFLKQLGVVIWNDNNFNQRKTFEKTVLVDNMEQDISSIKKTMNKHFENADNIYLWGGANDKKALNFTNIDKNKDKIIDLQNLDCIKKSLQNKLKLSNAVKILLKKEAFGCHNALVDAYYTAEIAHLINYSDVSIKAVKTAKKKKKNKKRNESNNFTKKISEKKLDKLIRSKNSLLTAEEIELKNKTIKERITKNKKKKENNGKK